MLNTKSWPKNYTVEVMNRFKGLDLADRVPEKLWMEVHYIVQESVIKTTLKKKNKMHKGKVIVRGGFAKSWGEKRSER